MHPLRKLHPSHMGLIPLQNTAEDPGLLYLMEMSYRHYSTHQKGAPYQILNTLLPWCWPARGHSELWDTDLQYSEYIQLVLCHYSSPGRLTASVVILDFASKNQHTSIYIVQCLESFSGLHQEFLHNFLR